MKKKIIFSIILAIMLAVSYTVPSVTHTSDCFAKAKSKYVKIKKTVWKEYKEGYTVTLPAYKKKVTSLNKTVKSQKATIASKNKTIASQKTVIQENSKAISNQKVTIANQRATISDQKLQISDLNATIKDKKSTISWLWKQLEAFGFMYDYDKHQWEPVEETAEEPQPEIETLNMAGDISQVDLIEEQTGLHITCIQLIESYGEWAAYYINADGDLYVVTVAGGAVDVCVMLN